MPQTLTGAQQSYYCKLFIRATGNFYEPTVFQNKIVYILC